jgi:hypothetical protein
MFSFSSIFTIGTTDSTRHGAVDLTIENVLDTDHGYDVFIDDERRKSGVTSKTCTIIHDH